MEKSQSQKQQKQQKQEQQDEQQKTLEKLFIGGGGAAEYAIAAYGDANDQQRISPIDNAIAVRNGCSAGGAAIDIAGLIQTRKLPKDISASLKTITSMGRSNKKYKGHKGKKSHKKGGNLSKNELQEIISKQLKQLKKGGALQPLTPAEIAPITNIPPTQVHNTEGMSSASENSNNVVTVAAK